MSEQKHEQTLEEFDTAYANHAFDVAYEGALEELHDDLDDDWLKEYEANDKGTKVCNIDNPDCESCT